MTLITKLPKKFPGLTVALHTENATELKNVERNYCAHFPQAGSLQAVTDNEDRAF